MKYLEKFKLFENLQQADNYVANNNNLDTFYYEQLKDYIKEKGKLGLLYILTLILYSSPNQEYELNRIEQYVDKINAMNIKIDTNDFVRNTKLFYQYVDNQINKIEANKFVDEFAPGFLKKEIKQKYLDQISQLDLNKIEKESLRGKMSVFHDPEKWVKYVSRLAKGKDDLRKLRSEDVKILYENEEWLIYVPESYEAINYINFPQWCTISEDKYDDYIEKGYYFIILFNKMNKKLSYIIQVFPEHDILADETAPENTKNYFSIHPYNGNAVWISWYPETNYYGWDIEKLNTGILKIFFDKFVRNNKISI